MPAHPDVGQVGDLNIMGLAYGAVLSACLHLLVQLPGVIKLPDATSPLAFRLASPASSMSCG